MFPIGLGLKVLFGSAILTVLSFGLLLLLWSFYQKGLWSFLFNALLAFFVTQLVMNQEGKIEQLVVPLQC
jgi:hypothetical protein